MMQLAFQQEIDLNYGKENETRASKAGNDAGTADGKNKNNKQLKIFSYE